MDWVGRIELCVERTWTTLCDKTWDLKDAAVTCRQLGYSSYGMQFNAYTTVITFLIRGYANVQLFY